MKQFRKRIVLYTYVTLGVFLFEIVFPATASALTGGPTTPEVQSFTPIGTSDMVDVFSGDFKYNIPLLEVDGYPVNISYSGGINMDQEASWVGLGWNLNPGTVTRNMRGIPDDFKGDEITQETNMRTNWTVGVKAGLGFELFGSKKLNNLIDTRASFGVNYNNYTGLGLEGGLNVGISEELSKKIAPGLNAGLNLNYSGNSGLTISPNLNYSSEIQHQGYNSMGVSSGLSASAQYNSRSGMRALNFGYSLTMSPATNNKYLSYKQTQRVNSRLGFTGSAIEYGSPTYTPTISIPMNTFALNLRFGFGKELYGFTTGDYFEAYYTQQSVKEPVQKRPAYGYQFLQEADEESMMDLNREHDKAFSENHTNLPVPIHTPDIYSVSGHGIGGAFRFYRNDNVNYREGTQENSSNDIGVGFEIAGVKTFKGGLNLSYANSNTSTGNWFSGNALQDAAQTVGREEVPLHPQYEPAYLKQMGEPTGSNIHLNPAYHAYSLIEPGVSYGSIPRGYTSYVNKNDPTGQKIRKTISADPTQNVQTTRQPRNMVMYGLTVQEATQVGSTRNLVWLPDPHNTPSNGKLLYSGASRSYGQRKQHHISEMNVIGADGTRYIYSLPAYNITQTEITFAADDGEANCKTGLIHYDPADLYANSNSNGRDHYIQKVTTPGHAYAYLLTGIVSPDYVDLGHDGITDDDLGTATRFNYFKAADYKWRVPFAKDSANYSRGNAYDTDDDKGSIIYGEKEMFYLHSIEGKNHIAVFYISLRADGAGVKDIHGGLDQEVRNVQYKLDSVVLYNKQDYLQNGINAYKIKAAHFKYDYSLCKHVPNFYSIFASTEEGPHRGKLTLKAIYFTYGKSFKGKLSPYSFSYNDVATIDASVDSLVYNSKSQDRWGAYMPSGGGTCGSLTPNSSEFPFTPQDREKADAYAGAWCLNEIVLPSGGKISVEYESDSYAYVQDKRALRMYKIAGFSPTDDEADMTDLLYTINGNQVHTFVFFELGEASTQEEVESLVEGIKTAQVTVHADINGKGKYEYVRGYVDLEQGAGSYGICSTNNQLGFCRMVWVPIRDNGNGRHVNPLSMNIWNWARINSPDLVFNQHITAEQDWKKQIGKAFYELVGLYNEIVNITIGMYGNLRLRGFGQKVSLDGSWIRLNAGNYEKLGGGHRVKSIRINDNWAYMGSMNSVADDAEYGQEYDYTLEETLPDGTRKTITSGVAQYEPMVGSDENPFHMPSYTREEYAMVPDIRYMDDQPYGESFMPPASVGYRQVTVRNLSHDGVKRSATGKQVYQFYTAKEFPVKISETDMAPKIIKPSFTDQLFNFTRLSETKVSAGQGYLIELNDMHGKPRAEYTYSETSIEPIGGVIHEYLCNPNNPNELSNTVKVVAPNGSITTQDIATEVEVYNDFRQSLAEMTSASVDMNLDFFNIGIIPFLIPSLYGGYSKSFTKVQTAVTVKVVNRYGIEHKTIAIKEGSRIQTENLLYDALSGNVLVSSVQNEFEDNLYNISTPAHWAFDEGMGPAYKNIGLELNEVTLLQDSIVLPNGLNVRDYLVPGDIVLVMKTDPNYAMYGGMRVYEGKNQKLNLILEPNGLPYYDENPIVKYKLRVINSGRKNMHNLPIEQVSALHHPALTSTLSIDSVVSASAVTYKDLWPFYCDSYFLVECDTVYGLPADDFQDYFNTLFQATDVMAGKREMDSACIANQLINSGYTYRDTLYTKIMVEGFPVLEPMTDESCLACQDSLFIETGEDIFLGIPVKLLQSCWISSTNCNTTNYAEEIENHALYEKMRYFWDSMEFSCPPESNDTSFDISVTTNFPVNGQAVINYQFGRCGNLDACGGYIAILDNVCFTQIMEITEISIRDNNFFDLKLRVQLPDGSYDTLNAEAGSDCLPTRWVYCEGHCETPTTSTILNPYRLGMLGNWRLHRNYAYVDTRSYATQAHPRIDGTFTDYSPYWVYDAGEGKLVPGTSTKWTWATEVTKYTPFGNEIENQDALGRYSAAVFGFNYTLPVAVGGNTKYEQIAYEGFEENSLFWQNANCYEGHFSFAITDPEQGEITDEQSHSGIYSLQVNAGETISSTQYSLETCEEYVDPLDSNAMLWQNCNCIGKFSPKEGKYIVSAWVKQGNDPTDTTYANAKIQVILATSSGSSTLNFYASGPIVDGWQRIYAEVDIDENVESVEIKLVAAAGEDTWFDDFRMHPFNSNMKSYAYDQVTLRLLAELDENNFATFYEYDLEGALIRVKKETERGIMTLKEVRKHIVKLP